jgi:acetyl esterase/lipase
MNTLKRISRIAIRSAAFLSLLSGVAHLLRVRSRRSLILRAVKAIGEGISPFLAIAGAASAMLALWIHAPYVVIAGAIGGALNARYIRHVTRPHHAFEDPFGEDWETRLYGGMTLQQQSALLRHRWYWRMPRSRKKIAWKRNMVYHVIPAADGKPEIPLQCDLWLPPENIVSSGTAIIYIHGGGYYTTAKDFGTRTFFRHLVAQGHMAMDINYRLAPEANLFDMLSDVLHAVAWLKENAVLFGAQPEHVVLAGGSAGAQLALLAAYAHDNPQLTPPDLQGCDLSVRAAVSYYGVIDLAETYRRLQVLFSSNIHHPIPDSLFDRPVFRRALAAAAWVRGVEPQALRSYVNQNQAVLSAGLETAFNQLLGGSPDEAPEAYTLVSPLTYAGPGCPPTLLFQAAHDYLLDSAATRSLHERLRAAGVPAVYIELPQTEHTFDQFLPEFSPPAQVALYDLERFLALTG